MSRLYGQFVTLGTESGNHAGRDVREERMLPEVLTRKNVGQVHLDERDGNAQQGIAQGDAGMRERTRIENDQAMPSLPARCIRSTSSCSALLWNPSSW